MRSGERRQGGAGGHGGRRSGSRQPWGAYLLLLAAVACATTLATRDLKPYHRTTTVEDPGEFVGAEECEDCHEDVLGYAPAPEYHGDCEACHGPGELHYDSEEVDEIRYPSNDDCIACHETGQRTLLEWTTSEHQQTGVFCSDCHAVHNREPWHLRKATKVQGAMLRHAGGTTRMCASCHPEVAATFDLPSHHLLREGMLRCTDCHPAHGSVSRTLGAPTQLCTDCHQDHAGPWIYEHAPVAEDCSYCHAPHGSSFDGLLETSQPGSCITCHSVAEMGAVHDPWAFVTRCTDCHSAIHGSYTDPILRR